MQIPWFDHDFTQNVILLEYFDHTCGLAEDILDNFRTSFNKLILFHHQQRSIFIDFMGFFRNPEQCASLDDFIALLTFTALSNFHTRKLDNTAALGLVSIINQFRNYLIINQLSPWRSFQREALTTLSFENIMLTTLVAFFLNNRLIQHHRCSDNFYFAVMTAILFTKTHHTTMLSDQTSFGKHITFMNLRFVFDRWLSPRRQVINFTSQYPNPTFFTTSDITGVTLTVFLLFDR